MFLLFEVLKAQPRLTLCMLNKSSINELYWLLFAIFLKLFYLLWRNQSHKKCCLLCSSKNTTGLRIHVYVCPGSGISPGAYFGLLLATHFFVIWVKKIEKRHTGHNVEDRYIYNRVKRCTFKTQQWLRVPLGPPII